MILRGNCIDKLKELPANSVDAIVTDPPYGLSFMGKKWDYDVPGVDIWRECIRVLKPGGHLLAFAGTRTQHRMACNIEDAGFEIRDMIAWVYGSGFPKSLNVGKAVDQLQGNEREVRGKKKTKDIRRNVKEDNFNGQPKLGTGAPTKYMEHVETTGSSPWEGYGTALKPALEPITVARKPLEGTVAENVLKWGTGGINIDGCRVGADEIKTNAKQKGSSFTSVGNAQGFNGCPSSTHTGRFPANLIHDGSDEVLAGFPETGSGTYKKTGHRIGGNSEHTVGINGRKDAPDNYGDSGSAARFFYCAKASKAERDEGCEGLPERDGGHYAQDEWSRQNMGNTPDAKREPRRNHHPTVKPIALMKYLVTLVAPEGATVLDPFAGSGTTALACIELNRNYILIEREPEYIQIAQARIKGKTKQPSLFPNSGLLMKNEK